MSCLQGFLGRGYNSPQPYKVVALYLIQDDHSPGNKGYQGKVRGKIVNEKVRKKSGKFMENVKFRGKCFHCSFYCQKQKQCNFLLYR